jgi:hypothetical protein
MSSRRNSKHGQQKKCWCLSGRVYKNCHGLLQPKPEVSKMHLQKLVLKGADDPLGAKLPSEVMLEPNAGDNKTPWGIPGEEHKIVLYPIPRYDSHGNVPTASPDDLAGKPGQYKVQFLLSRPRYPIAREREHKFIDDVVGSSHLLIAKPKRSRAKGDTDRIMLQNNMTRTGKTLFLGLPNDEGYLGKFVAENVWAQSSADAERNTYGAFTPFLSAWSVNFDIPLHIETMWTFEGRQIGSGSRESGGARCLHFPIMTRGFVDVMLLQS